MDMDQQNHQNLNAAAKYSLTNFLDKLDGIVRRNRREINKFEYNFVEVTKI